MLGGFFSGMLWVCTHIVPLGSFPLVRMAFNSLNRRGVSLVFAMIALFIGVLSMSLGMVVTQKSGSGISALAAEFQSYNLNILAAADQEAPVQQAIQEQHPEKLGVGYRTALAGMSVAGGGPVSFLDAVLVGRSDPEDYVISGAAWGSQPDGVYAHKGANLNPGSQVEVTFHDGTTRIFTVVGSYDVNYRTDNLYPPTRAADDGCGLHSSCPARCSPILSASLQTNSMHGCRPGNQPAAGHRPQPGGLCRPLHEAATITCSSWQWRWPGWRCWRASCWWRIRSAWRCSTGGMRSACSRRSVIRAARFCSILAVEYGLAVVASAAGVLGFKDSPGSWRGQTTWQAACW